MNHCNIEIKPYETWYLENVTSKKTGETSTDRVLKLGKCPVCKSCIVELSETNLKHEKIYTKQHEKQEALRVIEKNRKLVVHSDLDIKASKKVAVTMPNSIRYGENKVVRIGNKTKLRQRAVTFNSNGKELIKEVQL